MTKKQATGMFRLFLALSVLVLGAGCERGGAGGGARSDDAALSFLEISPGELSPAFNSITSEYAAQIDDSVSSMTVTWAPADAGTTVSINGVAAAPGVRSRSLRLDKGFNSINIAVISGDGTMPRTYEVHVMRNYCSRAQAPEGSEAAGKKRDEVPGKTASSDAP